MSEYPFIVQTLRDFDLITQERCDEAIAEYEWTMAEYDERQAAYREAWHARRALWPWWKRFWRSGDWWMTDWYKEPFEVRWPTG